MAGFYSEDFPFEEIRDENGDYFSSAWQPLKLGYKITQIWSVAEHDGTWCYGPPFHVVNVIGYIATTERHDNETYYEEPD